MPHPGPELSTAMLDAAVDLIGRSGVRGSVEVAGVSMHPTFSDVERLAVEFAPAKPAFGDVIVFRQRGTLVVHRLVQQGTRLRTRGDGTISFDPWLDPGDVIGRVFALEYPGGVWRGIRGRRARCYGWWFAAHSLCWGALGALLLKLGLDDWQWRLGRVDRLVLALVHALAFRALNPVVPAPELEAGYTPRSHPGKKPTKQ